ncbi:unnamed protein product [Symbiodinium sp. CCMP2592]|nr:unnamed protein product [Symbiodinium sp. CCMP2592]
MEVAGELVLRWSSLICDAWTELSHDLTVSDAWLLLVPWAFSPLTVCSEDEDVAAGVSFGRNPCAEVLQALMLLSGDGQPWLRAEQVHRHFSAESRAQVDEVLSALASIGGVDRHCDGCVRLCSAPAAAPAAASSDLAPVTASRWQMFIARSKAAQQAADAADALSNVSDPVEDVEEDVPLQDVRASEKEQEVPSSSSTAPHFRQGFWAKAAKGTLRAAKWGRCGRCLHPLRFYIFQGGRTPGRPALVCSKWFTGGSADESRCWFQKPFPPDRFDDLTASEKEWCKDIRVQLQGVLFSLYKRQQHSLLREQRKRKPIVSADLERLREATLRVTQLLRATDDDDVLTVLALLLDILQTLICNDDWLMLELHQVVRPASLSYAGPAKDKQKQRQLAPLRRLSQLSYEEIVQMPEKTAAAWLTKHNVFGQKKNSLKIPQDAAAHLLARSHESTDKHYALIRHALAFKQMAKNAATTFKPGVLEWDGTRTTSRKRKTPDGKVSEHRGRLLIGAHRSGPQSVVYPLPNKHCKAGSPGPPESYDEVIGIISKKVPKGDHAIASDAGTGLQKAWRALGMVSATARHNRAEYTPVTKVPRKQLGSHALSNLSFGNRAKITARKVTMVGGDQRAESLAGTIKKALRRTNKLGQKCLSKDRDHVDALASFQLNQEPGLQSVIDAVVAYRAFCEDKVSPAVAWTDTSWLGLAQ